MQDILRRSQMPLRSRFQPFENVFITLLPFYSPLILFRSPLSLHFLPFPCFYSFPSIHCNFGRRPYHFSPWVNFKFIPLHDGPIATFVGPLLGSRPRDPVYFPKSNDRFVMSLKRKVKEDLWWTGATFVGPLWGSRPVINSYLTTNANPVTHHRLLYNEPTNHDKRVKKNGVILVQYHYIIVRDVRIENIWGHVSWLILIPLLALTPYRLLYPELGKW